MTAHTPGPWAVTSMRAFRKSFEVTVGLNEPFTFGSVADGTAILMANARLIAAAPELLEALRAVLPRVGMPVDHDTRVEWRAEVEDAIAKATGATP